MRDKGFGGGRELGEEAKAILGFMDPGWLTGVELELLGGRDWPVSVEKLPPLPTSFPLVGPAGLERAVLGDAHPGEPMATAGDLR